MYAELFDFKAQLCLAFEYTAGKEWNRREVAVKVILIDAFSQIFRCYFAITHLTNADGEPTNAVFGFARLLLGIERDFQPSGGALCFDCGKPEFRLAIAPDYKAGRPPMPEDLAAQLGRIRELTAAFGWSIVEEQNYEADDLIAAFIKAVEGRGETAAFISQDKDLAQLVSQQTSWLAPDRKNSGFEQRGTEEVAAKFGVQPCQMVDYLALLGDASDHIPGVPGIGAKTAAKIITSGVSVDDILAGGVNDVPGVSARIIALLRENGERVAANRKLISLRTDLPARLQDIDSVLQKKAPDWKKIAEFFVRNGLRSLMKEVPEDFRNVEISRTENQGTEDLPLFAADAGEVQKTPVSGVMEQGTLF